MKRIKVRIITPHGLYKETRAEIVNVFSTEGQRGILPNHMPIVLALAISRMELEEEKRETYAIVGGMLHFKDNECLILTPAIESQAEIDLKRAQESKARAEARLKSTNYDLKRAELSLKRALNRIAVKNYH